MIVESGRPEFESVRPESANIVLAIRAAEPENIIFGFGVAESENIIFGFGVQQNLRDQNLNLGQQNQKTLFLPSWQQNLKILFCPTPGIIEMVFESDPDLRIDHDVWERLEDLHQPEDSLIKTLQECPVAAFMSKLLAWEASLLPRAALPDFGGYVTSASDQILAFLEDLRTHELIDPEDELLWGLNTGMARFYSTVRNFSEANPGPENIFSVAAISKFCSLKDLQVFRSWAVNDESLHPYLRLVDFHAYVPIGDGCKCAVSFQDSDITDFNRIFRSFHVHTSELLSDASEEFSAIFSFIIDNYGSSLPHFLVFLHPDAPIHQTEDFHALKSALGLVSTGSGLAKEYLQFYPLGAQFIPDATRTKSTGSGWQRSRIVRVVVSGGVWQPLRKPTDTFPLLCAGAGFERARGSPAARTSTKTSSTSRDPQQNFRWLAGGWRLCYMSSSVSRSSMSPGVWTRGWARWDCAGGCRCCSVATRSGPLQNQMICRR